MILFCLANEVQILWTVYNNMSGKISQQGHPDNAELKRQ